MPSSLLGIVVPSRLPQAVALTKDFSPAAWAS